MKKIGTFVAAMAVFSVLLATAPLAQPGAQPGKATEVSLQTPKELYAGTLIGANVTNPEGENLDTIAELVIDPKEARITTTVVSVGGFLGIGAKLVAIPWSDVTLAADGETVIIAKGKEELTNAPSWKKAEAKTTSDR